MKATRGIFISILTLVFLWAVSGGALAAIHCQFWKYREGDSPRTAFGDFPWLYSAINEDSEWQSEWKDFDFPRQPPLSGQSHHVWLSARIPASNPEENTLFFVTTNQSFRVWMDDRIIYQYGTLAHKDIGYGWRWHFIALPDRARSHVLTFQMFSDSPESLGRLSQFSIDTADRQFQNLIGNDLSFLVNLPIVGLLLVIMVVFCLNQQEQASRMLYHHIIAFLAAFGLWIFCVSNMTVFIWDRPAFWWCFAQELIYIIPAIGTRIVEHLLSGQKAVWARHIRYGYIGLLAVSLVAEIASQSGLSKLLPVLFLYMIVTQLFVIWWLFQEGRAGDLYCRALLVPAVVIPVLALVDASSRTFDWISSITSLTAYGILAFAVFVMLILRDQFLRERKLITLANSLELEVASAIELSEIDPLTKCFNRRKFDETVVQAVAASRAAGIPLSLLMLDIDFFKKINDTYGHDIGDRTLINFAETIRRHLDHHQTLYRWGGEEFMVLCRGLDLDTSTALGESLRQAVAASSICPDKPEPVTCSVGVASWHDGDANESVFRRVDEALYTAKQTGRNRVVAKGAP